MIDISSALEPKTKQLNADHLRNGKSLTIKVTDVKKVSGDQQIVIHHENENGLPYLPCKSMLRVLSAAWTEVAENWVGKSMTLVCDPKVRYGADEVGGIRITHLSHIPETLVVALTVTRGNRKPYRVAPLNLVPAKTLTKEELEILRIAGEKAAHEGRVPFLAWWNSAEIKPLQKALTVYLAAFQEIVESVKEGETK